jgi:anti-sigma factor ChrR (cupin superfamily)
MTETLNADFSQRAVMHTTAMDWQASPSPSVWRKRLDLAAGAETSRVTSVVRYDAGSSFALHPHPCGEEIFVLDGVFADEHGEYPAGTYLLNPQGFNHAPFSKQGCVLFVKLQQYPSTEHITIDTKSADWPDTGVPELRLLTLYDNGRGETVRLARFAPGCRVPAHDHVGGEELFVIAGEVADEFGAYPAGTWIRQPDASRHEPVSAQGATL